MKAPIIFALIALVSCNYQPKEEPRIPENQFEATTPEELDLEMRALKDFCYDSVNYYYKRWVYASEHDKPDSAKIYIDKYFSWAMQGNVFYDKMKR